MKPHAPTSPNVVWQPAILTGAQHQAHNHTVASPALGWNMYTLDTPVFWDGTSNLLVDVSYHNTAYTQYS